ncbi:hypothetical protein D6850_07920 [Roseovarius spongiae]|uniref:SH3 domain-containing protein n=1 Tax=Roseovarius spongiae TaxID=2320272 RepID=A0A3A8ATC6_9RHOB|nr:hypothetical protein D6850_07920 [Roseovarius spongiae]
MILAAALLGASAMSAAAQSPLDGHGPDAWAVTGVAADDTLNLRAGPGTRYPRIAKLAPNARGIDMVVCVPTLTYQQYRALEAAGHKFAARWCLVRLGERLGWANAAYLAEDAGGPAALDAGIPTDGPEAALPGVVHDFMTRWINGDFYRDRGALRRYVTPDIADHLLADTGADNLLDGQDHDIRDLDVTWGEPPILRGRANLVAHYRNFGQAQRLEFGMARVPGSDRFAIIEIGGPFDE